MNKKKTALVAVLALLGFAAVGLMAGVYAKYISSLDNKDATAKVAKWAFRTENNGKTDLIECKPSETYDETTLVKGRMAPGTKGECTIKVSNEDSEVGVDYTIVVSATGKPTNLTFYTDSGYSDSDKLTASGITGHLDAGAEDEDVKVIYWYWPYETAGGDSIDTAEGEAAGDMTITFAITGVQVEPEVEP